MPWKRFGSDLRAILDALSLSIQRLRDFFQGIVTEADPATSEDTLDEWYENQSLKASEGLTDDEKSAALARSFYSIGAQNIDYLNSEIQWSFPGNSAQESTTLYQYTIIGSAIVPERLVEFNGLLLRIMPALWEPVFDVGYLFDDNGNFLFDDDDELLIDDDYTAT